MVCETRRPGPSLAGQPLHTRRKGLASCLYATCSCCTVQCSPIRFVHVILNYAMFNYNIPYDRDRGCSVAFHIRSSQLRFNDIHYVLHNVRLRLRNR